MDKQNKKILYTVIGVSFIVLVIFMFRVINHGLNITSDEIKYDVTGQVGDFIGGVIGTIFSGAGFYFLYVTLVEQRKSFEKERFEAKFFDLIKLHRENVSDQNYTKFDKADMQLSLGRKVFRIIHKEFEECYSEVKRFHKIYGHNFIKERYQIKLNLLIEKNKLDVSIEELAIIDLAYTFLFFGVAKDGEQYLTIKFKHKFNDDFFGKLVTFLQLKPKKENHKKFSCWKYFINLNILEIKPIFEDIHQNRRVKNYNVHLKHMNFFSNLNAEKYYGGHQHRLGHYFRHLFQSYKFLYNESGISKEDKYFYGKTLRAQLSTYEQSLLFINSLSNLGLKWDLKPELNLSTNEEIKLITKFNLIKNVPGTQILDITYKKFYPNVEFEFEDN